MLGMTQHSGAVVIQMLANFKQASIAPLIKSTIALIILVFINECKIYPQLIAYGYQHKSVCHLLREDADGRVR